MSRGRRHVGRTGIKQREVRRAEAEASSPHAARWDIITRYAILQRHTARAWRCRQSNGRAKPAFRTLATAQRVIELLAALDPSCVFEAYRCRRADSTEKVGEHWHLASPRKVLTPPTEGCKVDVVRESNTSPEE